MGVAAVQDDICGHGGGRPGPGGALSLRLVPAFEGSNRGNTVAGK